MGKTKGMGVMPAVMTFWNEDESYNEKETLRYVQWVMDQGAHSISCVGSTGDNISMSMEEQKMIMKSIIDFVDHRVPVYPGTGRYSTAQTIELSKYAQECGADGVLVIMPYYLQPHKRAVVNHFRKLRGCWRPPYRSSNCRESRELHIHVARHLERATGTVQQRSKLGSNHPQIH